MGRVWPIVLAHKSISALPSPLVPLKVSTLFQVSPITTPSNGAPFTSSTVTKMVCMPLAQPLLRASGHKRHEAIRKSIVGVGVSVGTGVGGTGVSVGISLGTGLEVSVGEGVWVEVTVWVGRGVGLGVAVWVGVNVGVAVAV